MTIGFFSTMIAVPQVAALRGKVNTAMCCYQAEAMTSNASVCFVLFPLLFQVFIINIDETILPCPYSAQGRV